MHLVVVMAFLVNRLVILITSVKHENRPSPTINLLKRQIPKLDLFFFFLISLSLRLL